MYERFSLFLGQALISRPRLKDLVKREEGQGITEYGMAVAFVVVALVAILALLKGHIQTFINKVGDDIEKLPGNL
jgi:pilus assembly protein Flp/PilA